MLIIFQNRFVVQSKIETSIKNNFFITDIKYSVNLGTFQFCDWTIFDFDFGQVWFDVRLAFHLSHSISNLYASRLFFLSFSLSFTHTHTLTHSSECEGEFCCLRLATNVFFLNMPIEQGALNSLSFLYVFFFFFFIRMWICVFFSFIAHKTITAQQRKCRRNRKSGNTNKMKKNCLSDFVRALFVLEIVDLDHTIFKEEFCTEN
jgi:hypothetical protein